MNVGDVLILGFVTLWLILVFCYMRKKKGSGKCLGCSGCDGENCTCYTDKKMQNKLK